MIQLGATVCSLFRSECLAAQDCSSSTPVVEAVQEALPSSAPPRFSPFRNTSTAQCQPHKAESAPADVISSGSAPPPPPLTPSCSLVVGCTTPPETAAGGGGGAALEAYSTPYLAAHRLCVSHLVFRLGDPCLPAGDPRGASTALRPVHSQSAAGDVTETTQEDVHAVFNVHLEAPHSGGGGGVQAARAHLAKCGGDSPMDQHPPPDGVLLGHLVLGGAVAAETGDIASHGRSWVRFLPPAGRESSPPPVQGASVDATGGACM